MTATWPEPDFLVQSPRRPAMAWLWSAVGLVVAAIALNELAAARHDLDLQRERLARASRRVPALSVPVRSAVGAASASEIDAAGTARTVVARISHPWDRILANVEAETPDGLQWLELDHDADDPRVHLEGTAIDVASVLRFVDNLSDRPGWSDVVLNRLRTAEGHDAATPSPPWRFDLHAGIDVRRLGLARPAGER